MTYRQVLESLRRLVDYERHPPLGPTTRAFHLRDFAEHLDALSAPHRLPRIVHVAGTRGKGTLTTLLAEAMHHRGLRVGLYRSPHVDDVRERITVNGAWISHPAFARCGEQVLKSLKSRAAGGDAAHRTHFECLTAIAFLHFQAKRVDWAVLETGLGGRLDSTNVVAPTLTIITPLGMDHVRILGDDPVSIAREKAGIIKEGVPCLLMPQPRSLPRAAIDAIRNRARELNAPLIEVASRWKGHTVRRTLAGQRVQLRRVRRGGGETLVDLPHIGAGAGLALPTVWAALEQCGLDVTPRKQPEKFTWPLTGRCEVVRRRPLALLDAAHCPMAARHLVETCEHLGSGPKRVCLMMMEDKDHAGFVRALRLRRGDAVALPAHPFPRAHVPQALAAVIAHEAPACEVQIFQRLRPALRWLSSHRPAGTLMVTGSFYHLAEARRALHSLWGSVDT